MESRHQTETSSGLFSLPALRVTGLQLFEKCPRQWQYKFLEDRPPDEQGKYAAIGTAAHGICESYLKGEDYLNSPQWKDIPEAERDNLRKYVWLLSQRQDKLIIIEHEFTLQMSEEALPIRGHMDLVSLDLEGCLVILDHKTNRRYNAEEYWRSRLQQLFYAWAARQIWPQVQRVKFCIGYINLGCFVEWETSAEDDQELLTRFLKLWEQLRAYDEAGEWPATFNEECSWCPIKGSCESFQHNVLAFDRSVKELSDQPLEAQFLWVQGVRKAAQKYEDELEETLINKLGEGNSTVYGDKLLIADRPEMRKVKFSLFWNMLQQAQEQATTVQLHEMLEAYLDDLFTVKVTAVDNLLKLQPALKELAQPLIKKVPSENVTLKVKLAGKAIAK